MGSGDDGDAATARGLGDVDRDGELILELLGVGDHEELVEENSSLEEEYG